MASALPLLHPMQNPGVLHWPCMAHCVAHNRGCWSTCVWTCWWLGTAQGPAYMWMYNVAAPMFPAVFCAPLAGWEPTPAIGLLLLPFQGTVVGSCGVAQQYINNQLQKCRVCLGVLSRRHPPIIRIRTHARP